jgi:cell division protein FtsQ
MTGGLGEDQMTSGPGPAQSDADKAQSHAYNWWKVGFFALAAAGTIAALTWVLFGSRLLVVRSVVVTGTHLVSRSQVLAVAGIPDGLPLARVNTSAAAHRIERITQIQSVTVSRDWPDRIVIAVTERRPVLAVPDGGIFYLVDPTGVAVEQVRQPPAGIPRFVTYGRLLRNPGVSAAASVLLSLPSSLAREVKSVTVPAGDAVTLHLADGIAVDWGSPGLTAQKTRVLAILMHTHARYYDVSAPATAVTG